MVKSSSGGPSGVSPRSAKLEFGNQRGLLLTFPMPIRCRQRASGLIRFSVYRPDVASVSQQNIQKFVFAICYGAKTVTGKSRKVVFAKFHVCIISPLRWYTLKCFTCQRAGQKSWLGNQAIPIPIDQARKCDVLQIINLALNSQKQASKFPLWGVRVTC